MPTTDQSYRLAGGPVGFLLIHGLGGTPMEMRYVAQGLAHAGHTVHVPQLAGHCSTADDLGATRWEDWYETVGGPYSSYEAIVDGVTGDLAYNAGNGGVFIERTTAQGGFIQAGTAIGLGTAQHLAWDDNAIPDIGRLRVYSLGCPGCTVDDQYRIRFFDTTCTIPRFNNSATQVTVLVLQNAAPSYGIPPLTNVNGHYWLLNSAGAVLNGGANSFSLVPGGTFVRNTSLDASGASGSIVITSDGGYGAVTGKAVAVEAATGFTFDTALTCRPH